MFKINDYMVYRHDVCLIKDIKDDTDNNVKFYVISPIDDNSLIINTPVDNRMNYIRDLISLEEANKIIDNIPNIGLVDDFTEKNLESVYRNLLNNGSHNELIQIIKTSYLRNSERISNKKRKSDKDEKYFKLAEKYLYNELSVVLNMSFEDTKNYVISRVSSLD